MFGITEARTPFLIAVIGISAIAFVTDLARGKIYNWLTFPGVLAGLAASLLVGRGGQSVALLAASAGGIGAGLLFYGWLFYVGAASGGDVKLLMALGAWGGFRYAAEVALLSVILGGVMALGVLLSKKRLAAFGTKMRRFMVSLAVRELEVEFPAVDHKLKMPFGVPMAIAAVWIAIQDPFVAGGWWT